MDIAHSFDGPWSAPSDNPAAVRLVCDDPGIAALIQKAVSATEHGPCMLFSLSDPVPPVPPVHSYAPVILHIGNELDATISGLASWNKYNELQPGGLICSTKLELLDSLLYIMPSKSIIWLVDIQADQILLALMSAMHPEKRTTRQDRLRDKDNEDAQAALLRLTDELARMGRWLTAISRQEHPDAGETLHQGPVSYRPGPDRRAEPSRPVDGARVRSEIFARRQRNRFFDDQLFGEPCWDMLLDLFAARLEDKRVSVSSLCIAAAVPPTTALRWIKYMTEVGLIERIADVADARRVFVRLSEDAAGRMASWFEAQPG